MPRLEVENLVPFFTLKDTDFFLYAPLTAPVTGCPVVLSAEELSIDSSSKSISSSSDRASKRVPKAGIFPDKDKDSEATDEDIEGAYVAGVIIMKWNVKGWAVDWAPL